MQVKRSVSKLSLSQMALTSQGSLRQGSGTIKLMKIVVISKDDGAS